MSAKIMAIFLSSGLKNGGIAGLTLLIGMPLRAQVPAPSATPDPQVAVVAQELALPPGSVESSLKLATTVVTYKTVKGVPLQIYVFEPKGLKLGEQRPAILFVHGGAWVTGDAAVHAQECIYFARMGLVTASINYRLIPPGAHGAKVGPYSIGVSPADCLADVKSAMRYFRSHATELHVDPDKIVACGGSAGGHLVSALATIKGYDDPADDKSISTRPAALILMYPAFDLVSGWKGGRNEAQRAGLDAKAFSPALLADKDFPPALLLAGTEDPISTEATDKQFIERVKSWGGDAELVEFFGQGHALFQHSPNDPHFQAVIYFMDKFLTRLGYLPAHQSIPPPVVKYQTFFSKP